MSVEVGQRIPDVPVVNAERKAVKLSEFLGAPLVLAFFPGAFTGTCTKEMCAFRDSLQKFNDMNAKVLGVSVDSPFAQKAFADQNRLNFTLLSDFNRHAVRAFGIEDPNFAGGQLPGVAKRSVFVLDKDGKVRYRWVSDNPGVEPNYEEVTEAIRKIAH
ncbi:MAG TPA: peroxiredoxin [bacterium]|nr:peroxiredoxin [bacterium]